MLIEANPTESDRDQFSKLFAATRSFAEGFSAESHTQLRGVDNGKAVGTYIEHAYRDFLVARGIVRLEDFGNSAKGIDLPSLNADVKVTSIRQPQSSSPFVSFRQKIEGLGYHLILFVYEKTDTEDGCFLPFRAVRFIPKERTADYQTTRGIRDIISREGDAEDIFAFLVERMIPVDEASLMRYAESLVSDPPLQGYLTISNPLQWRLQYNKVISGAIDDVVSLDPASVAKIRKVYWKVP